MSGWTEREFGAVKIKHHSTSSLIELTIATTEESETLSVETLWLDYQQFSELKKVIAQIEVPYE